MTKICILGAGGQLGLALQQVDWRARLGRGTPELLLADLPEVDLTRTDDLVRLIDDCRPDIVINAAAYTNVEGAEDDVARCRQVNVEAPGQLARLCARRNVVLVHASTDYVFDGDRSTPYTEDCSTGGLSVYGQSKADGERAVLQHGRRVLVARSSWLFGEGRNFVQTIIRLAQTRKSIQVVCDQTGCPTSAQDFAEAIARMLGAGCYGIYNFSNRGACTWYDFAREIVRLAGLGVVVEPVPTASMTLFKAARPTYSVMDCRKYIEATGHTPRRWHEALCEYLDALDLVGNTKAG